MPENEQEEFWSKTYAASYRGKNDKFDVPLGVLAWNKMLQSSCDISSYLECGCNIGRNLEQLSIALPLAKKSVIEINKEAYEYVKNKYSLEFSSNSSIVDSNLSGDIADLVFTIGVLIHIHPDQLLDNMKKMFLYSKKYILLGEYFNRTPVMIEYQGEKNKLFKSDFGKLFLENFNVKLLDYGFLWGHQYDQAGFDDITWWLFEKQK